MAGIIAHIIAHVTEQELRSNKNYVELKKDLERQAILTAEYRCVQMSTVDLILQLNPFPKPLLLLYHRAPWSRYLQPRCRSPPPA